MGHDRNNASTSPLPFKTGVGGGVSSHAPSRDDRTRPKPFTGWHMTAILLCAFAVVLGVNVIMARLATSTFSGEVVENSYVASQDFNRWLDTAAKEKAFGWKVAVSRQGDGRIVARLTGVPRGGVVTAVARHPLGGKADVSLAFAPDVNGAYVSDKALPDGRWILRFDVEAGGRSWHGQDQVEGREIMGQPAP